VKQEKVLSNIGIDMRSTHWLLYVHCTLNSTHARNTILFIIRQCFKLDDDIETQWQISPIMMIMQ